MALTPKLSATISGTTLTITDDTVYGVGGVGQEARNEVAIDFFVVRKLDAGNQTVTLGPYNSLLDTSITVTGITPGCYELRLLISPLDSSTPVEETIGFLAITPDCRVLCIGNTIRILDDTIYGTGNPVNRANVNVNFKVTYKAASGDIDIAVPVSDPLTVANAEILNVSDGHYVVDILYTPILEGNTVTKTTQILKTENTEDCIAKIKKDFFNAMCCDDDDSELYTYLKATVTMEEIAELVSNGNFSDASCLLDGIQVLCNQDCKGC